MTPLLDDKELIQGLMSDIKKIKEDLGEVKVSLAGLKVKSGIWGLVAGSLPVAGLILMYVLLMA